MYNQPGTQTSLIEHIKAKIKAYEWLSKFDFSWNMIAYCFIYGIVGLIFGMLLKKYARMLIIALLVTITIIAVLNYLDIIIFDASKFKIILGIQPQEGFDAAIRLYYSWIKDHIVYTISIVVGFIIGYLVG